MELGISLVLLTLVFAAVYRILSGNRIPWRYVWYGSLIASMLFTLGKTLMGYYLLYFSPASVYGAAGSVMVFMLWVYYSSLILFFGAELIQARRHPAGMAGRRRCMTSQGKPIIWKQGERCPAGTRRRRLMSELHFPGPIDPRSQRFRDYARQRQMSLSDLLLENRIIFLSGVINDMSGIQIVMQMLYLQYESKTQDIHFYISSPGGSVTATLEIYDTMQFLECPVATYCLGLAASGGAILLTAGTKGKRFALPNSKVMIHQPWGQVGGQVSDIEIQANEITKEHVRLNEILAKHTGQPVDRIEKETDRDRYFSRRRGQGVRLGRRCARQGSRNNKCDS